MRPALPQDRMSDLNPYDPPQTVPSPIPPGAHYRGPAVTTILMLAPVAFSVAGVASSTAATYYVRLANSPTVVPEALAILLVPPLATMFCMYWWVRVAWRRQAASRRKRRT
jgi:hypothetical protein